MAVKNAVQLITYPDSLGGNLSALHQVLQTHFPGLFAGGIHILPPFPSSGDRGFAPLSYLDIDPQFGAWEDLRRIAQSSPLVLDLMVNHLSADSAYFQDFIKKGIGSEYADLFIPLRKVWPGGNPPPQDVQKIFLRRPEPFSDFVIQATGQVERLWTTFGHSTPSTQIDIDVNSSIARQLLASFLAKFSENGARIVRLDAVGYVIKKPGTSCFFVEPDIYLFLEWISGLAASLGLELLPELHADYATQFRLAEKGYWIYDFILPYAILDALVRGASSRLKEYLRIRPYRQFTMLDCHDGIPVKPDLNGLYASAHARQVVDVSLSRGADLSRILSPAHTDPDGFDVHQIRGTYYSMLCGNDDAYLAARAIQFFTPGIPQVYYVGLLAGSNDPAAMQRTGDGRELNRHNYSLAEIESELRRPVVQRLLRLIRFRNECEAFAGTFELHDSDETHLHLAWRSSSHLCDLTVDLKSAEAKIRHTNPSGALVDFPL